MRRRLWTVLATATLGGAAGAQTGASPYRPVEPVDMPRDRDGVYTFHFGYKPPRIVQLDTPDKGRKTVWYMVYQVWNTSDTPQALVPAFELVTKDGAPQNFLDEPQPALFEQIRDIEDKERALNLQSSVSISKSRVPVTKVDSVPRAVYGVAIWVDAPEKAAAVNNFSVYVTGLSNGLAVQQADGGAEIISRKTLQLDFNKLADNARPRPDDITPSDNNGLGAERWIYRVMPLKKADPAAKPADPAKPAAAPVKQ